MCEGSLRTWAFEVVKPLTDEDFSFFTNLHTIFCCFDGKCVILHQFYKRWVVSIHS